jgi:hypothetical protein
MQTLIQNHNNFIDEKEWTNDMRTQAMFVSEYLSLVLNMPVVCAFEISTDLDYSLIRVHGGYLFIIPFNFNPNYFLQDKAYITQFVQAIIECMGTNKENRTLTQNRIRLLRASLHALFTRHLATYKDNLSKAYQALSEANSLSDSTTEKLAIHWINEYQHFFDKTFNTYVELEIIEPSCCRL